jgi:REP element-mobilizing transposase RayT
MARFPRVHFEGALYYIMTKADYKLNLFRDDSDRSYYLSLVFDYKSQYSYKLYSLALISNESHLLIEPSSGFTISQIMHDINANYTKYYNKKYERKGHLFEERFKAILIEKESYLSDITRYIHRIALKENPVAQLVDCKWSSYPCYVKAEQDKNICLNMDTGEVLDLFSNRPEIYKDYVEKALMEDMKAFEDKLYRTPVVGTKEFVERIKEISKSAMVVEVKQDKAGFLPEKRTANKLVSVFVVLIILFLGVNGFLLKNNAKLKRAINEINLTKDESFTKDLIATKQKLNRDLEEKYRADMVSYKVMAMRLKEIEKNKNEKGKKL